MVYVAPAASTSPVWRGPSGHPRTAHAAGFLAKSELSASRIGQIIGRES